MQAAHGTAEKENAMKTITLGSTGYTAPQNGFGCLPIQRDDMETSVRILRKAFDGGMRFFDTARAYTDSEEKIGEALSDVRDEIVLATKSQSKTPDEVKRDLDTSLRNLRTDHIDVYQFHFAQRNYVPGDGTGMYELMLDLKRQGVIKHIGITTHKLGIAHEIIDSGLYETLQYPMSYLSSEKEIELIYECQKADMGFIAMKGLAGGLIVNSRAAMAFIAQFDNAMPIWGIQRESELDEWLSYMDETPSMDAEMTAFIEKEKEDLNGEFCRGCGYCMPCPQGITINMAMRMGLFVRRLPSEQYFEKNYQDLMEKTKDCIECGQCMAKCPYQLSIPAVIRKNYEDYQNLLHGYTSTESRVR